MAGFETFRNRLPLIDHSLIADAEASDLAKTYCFSSLTQFLMRTFQLSHGEAASRVRAAAAIGPRIRCWGNDWSLCCRSWPLCNGKAP